MVYCTVLYAFLADSADREGLDIEPAAGQRHQQVSFRPFLGLLALLQSS